ncbi:MAG TPA: hypothetical protein PLZ15_06915 [Melioribacteraceae bacterium]|nr:hypothetical protein [Melioribacteraceae bacterium]
MNRIIKAIIFTSILTTSFPIKNLSQIELTTTREWKIGNNINSVLFSPDGKVLVAVDNVFTIFYNLPDWVNYKKLNIPAPSLISKITFSVDGKYLAGGCDDGNIYIWDALKFESADPSSINSNIKLSGPSEEITSLAFSPDGKCFVAGTLDGKINIWETSSWKSIKNITIHKGRVTDLAFRPDGSYLASSSSYEKFIRVWDVSTWNEKNKFFNEDKEYDEYDLTDFRNLCFSPDGKYLACATFNGFRDIISIWNMFWEGSIKSIHSIYITSASDLKFSPDGEYLFIAGSNSVLAIFNTSGWEAVNAIKLENDNPIRSISFSPDGNFISFAHGDKIFICSIDPPLTPNKEKIPKPQPKRK